MTLLYSMIILGLGIIFYLFLDLLHDESNGDMYDPEYDMWFANHPLADKKTKTK